MNTWSLRPQVRFLKRRSFCFLISAMQVFSTVKERRWSGGSARFVPAGELFWLGWLGCTGTKAVRVRTSGVPIPYPLGAPWRRAITYSIIYALGTTIRYGKTALSFIVDPS